MSKNGKWAQMDGDRYFADPEEIFALDEIVTEEVPIPEWTPADARARGEFRMVIVRGMNADESIAFQAKGTDYSKPITDPSRWENDWSREERNFELIRICAVKPDGSPLFTYEQVQRLKSVQNKPFTRILAACRRVNGQDTDDLRDTAKNGGGATPIGALPTVSPLPSVNGIHAASSAS